MIRKATFADANAVKALIRSSHERSKYAGRCGIAEKALENLVLALVMGQNAKGLGATHLSVAERDGKVVGFIAGTVNRVYAIGDAALANDNFLVNEGGRVGDTLALVDAYIAWARGIPQVIEIGLSWSDALPGADKIAALYARKGAHKVGEQWELRVDVAAEGVAA